MLTRSGEAAPTALRAALALIAAGTWAALLARVWRFTVDDAYTSLRYARNLAAGLGPTFNASGPRAEGFTSPLWVALLALPHLAHLPALAIAKLLGVLLAAATLALAWRWAGREAPAARGWAAPAAALWLAAIPATAVHAASGMETSLFACLLTALLAGSAAAARTPDGRAARALPALALLVTLARPEGALACGVALATLAALVPPAPRRALIVRTLAFLVAPLAALELVRLAWFGLPLPLPFYVKLANPGHFPGWPVLSLWLADHGLRLGVPLLVLLARPPRELRPALAAVIALAAFFALPQHLMGYQHRYLAPLDPAVCVLAALGLERAADAALRRGLAPPLVHALAVALVLGVGAAELSDARVDVHERLAYADGMAAAHERLGRELATLRPPPRLALSDAGAVPYLSNAWTLDLIGLNTAAIATSGRRDPAWILAQRPDVLVLVSRRPQRFEPWNWNPWEAPLLAAATRAGFARAQTLRFGPDYWLWVMAKPGTSAWRAVAAGA